MIGSLSLFMLMVASAERVRSRKHRQSNAALGKWPRKSEPVEVESSRGADCLKLL
ncbi:hypothetical protein BAUCODRAFT_534303 [Baudoinia panamericana UAMH 10762]|uniref:Uncharacterized protein n=1 Tax=Baudoinia panamericana (strain UAMH 10762) TaxID=717646 RepID=M2N857_BAUPA|nr:uncharacterized protein BAUCODRAFT_534303 [Baudoinia panamericana UAMH 10762]EMC95284.1 hypothetical protein BAUCODRAFT_534303 [Baudoinia panamericana UAMH 10762]